MKKTLVLAIAMLFAVSAFAQVTQADFEASKDRIAQLKKVSTPDKAGASDIDKLASKAIEAKRNTLAIEPTLTKFLEVILGEQDSAVISVEECARLKTKIEEQSKLLGDVPELTGKATADLKNVKPMNIGKAKKSLEASKQTLTLSVEETAFQTKAIAFIMSAIAG